MVELILIFKNASEKVICSALDEASEIVKTRAGVVAHYCVQVSGRRKKRKDKDDRNFSRRDRDGE